MDDAGNVPSAVHFQQIVDKETHDAVVHKPNQAANIPIVIVVTSSTPNSKTLSSATCAALKEAWLSRFWHRLVPDATELRRQHQ